MTEKILRRLAFWMFCIFVPVALVGGLLRGFETTSTVGYALIVVGLIGALLGFIILKIAGPPKMGNE